MFTSDAVPKTAHLRANQHNGDTCQNKMDSMAKNSTILLMSVLLLLMLSVSGCANSVSPSPHPSSAPSTPSYRLEPTAWALTSFATETGQENLLSNTTVTATFDNGNITGSAGCNRYSAGYQLSGNGIAISSITSTLMYCTAPDGVMTQETTYLLLLKNVTAYAINNDQLTLSNELGDAQLIFNAANATT
ncbi:MAG: META domain-containing protein [Halobacteriota archaeon]